MFTEVKGITNFLLFGWGKNESFLSRGKIKPFWVGKKSTKIREEIQEITGRGVHVGRPGHPLWKNVSYLLKDCLTQVVFDPFPQIFVLDVSHL